MALPPVLNTRWGTICLDRWQAPGIAGGKALPYNTPRGFNIVSGHSKWSTIKHQKGAADAKRGVLFTKLSRDITLAVRDGGGGDPDMNFRLRLVLGQGQEQQHAPGQHSAGD